MKHISFLGAAGTVTGSSYLLKEGVETGILIDLGMFQGADNVEHLNRQALPLHPDEIEAVFLTHAHLDHAGRLPLLRKLGFSGPIYLTEATKSLLALILQDAVHVAKEQHPSIRMYDEEDVSWVLSKSVVVPYGQEVSAPHFGVTFRDAGHILGSAFLEVACEHPRDGIARIVFSGDIGNYPEALVKPTEKVSRADLVIMESTYGDHNHAKDNPADILVEEIEAIENSGGTLLIPAFSIERSQELLHMLDHLKRDRRIAQDLPVFLDSPLAIHVTHVYSRFRQLYSRELAAHSEQDNPFDFPGLHFVDKRHDSMRIDAFPGPKVIIAGSGMMTGGRILRHALEYLPQEGARVLFVGFQAIGTLGRLLLDGAKRITIDNTTIPVRASMRKSSGLSSHADQSKLLAWLSNISGVSAVVLTHGENIPRRALAEKIKEFWPDTPVYLPMRNETLHFGKTDDTAVYYGSSEPARITPQTWESTPPMTLW